MKIDRHGDVAIVYADSEHNNSYNLDVIREEEKLLEEAEQDDGVRSLVITSTHPSIFCPGADLPTLMGYSRVDILRFFSEMTDHIRRKFTYPKPVVYALNGHTLAAGFTLALTGEYRIMADGPYKIGMMEIDVGISAPFGPVEMFTFVLGGHRAGMVFLAGETYTPREACELGLIDEVVEAASLMDRAIDKAELFGAKPSTTYRRLKRYLRQPIAERMARLDERYIEEMVEQWFEEETQALLRSAVERLTRGAKTPRK